LGVVEVKCYKYGEIGHKYRVSIEREERKGGICSKVTKGTPTKGASIPYKGRSAGKEVEESRRKRGSACGLAMRSTARRVEKEFSSGVEKESRGTLWRRSTRGSTPTRVRIVHGGSNSDVCIV